MIIIDMSQIVISACHVQLKDADIIDLKFFRHMIINMVRSYSKQHKKEFGKVVIAIDSKDNWRKDVMVHYKANRKKKRDESKYDWDAIFVLINQVIEEIKANFLWKVIEVYKAEADDIIGYLTITRNSNEKIIIISADSDFIQLHRYKGVKQYSPMQKKYLTSSNPDKDLKEKIIKGDSGDGICNILSPDSSLVDKIRQKSVSKKNLELWLGQPEKIFCNDEMLERFKMNENLIDLRLIPAFIGESIEDQMTKRSKATKTKLYGYLLMNDMPLLAECLADF